MCRSLFHLGVFTLLTCLLCLGSNLVGFAEDTGEGYGYSDDGLWMYVIYEDTGEVSVTCQDTEIVNAVIPSKIDGYTITMIEARCFDQNEYLETVEIPNTITSIEDWAFYGCTNLQEINIPSSVVTIKWEAFYNCASVTTVTIPASVKELQEFVFEGCTSLTSIYVSDANKYYCDVDGVLYDKDITTIIKYPDAKEGTEYTLPETCTIVEDWAFVGATLLESITLGDQVTEIGEDAFYGCTALQSIVIPEGITILDGSVFGLCSALESVSLPTTLESIGDGCFMSCTALTSIEIPESVTTLGAYAFLNCVNLLEIALTESCTSVGVYSLGYYINDSEEYVKIPGFVVDTLDNTAAFSYCYTNAIECTGGITTATIFIYIIFIIIGLVVIFVIAISIAMYRIKKRHELK